MVGANGRTLEIGETDTACWSIDGKIVNQEISPRLRDHRRSVCTDTRIVTSGGSSTDEVDRTTPVFVLHGLW